jgi:PhzF family phenazine biosynthesis protein
MTARIRHVDAFTSTPLEGNPAAVVDGEGLDGDTMQRIALNQKLSETVFLLRPASAENSARLRIFTPAAELPFAGHPVVAAAHVLVSESLARPDENASLRLETGAGVIPVAVTPGPPPLYTMTQATPRFRAASVDAGSIAAAVGLTATDITRLEYVWTGIEWLIAQVASLEAMLRVRPDMTALTPHALALFCVGAQAADADVHVRAFAPGSGVPEDPVTGSANGCIGALVARDSILPWRDGAVTYVSEQGIEMGQPGRAHVHATQPDGAISVQVGGSAVTVLRGDLLLDG